jgi:hypothetical protein
MSAGAVFKRSRARMGEEFRECLPIRQIVCDMHKKARFLYM